MIRHSTVISSFRKSCPVSSCTVSDYSEASNGQSSAAMMTAASNTTLPTRTTATSKARAVRTRHIAIGTPATLRTSKAGIQAGRRVVCTANASEAERADWARRASESGVSMVDSNGQWRWTLNWSFIDENIIIGSCPRSPGDIETMAQQSGATALLNLQTQACFDALQIDYPVVREKACELGLVLVRIPTYDFNRADQANALPEAVRVLNLLLAKGHRVYVHCTAGINRAALVVMGYLTFVRGQSMTQSLEQIKAARQVCNPYLDSWKAAKSRLLMGREEDVREISRQIYERRMQNGNEHNDNINDWREAETQIIKKDFDRKLEIDLSVANAILEAQAIKLVHVKDMVKRSKREAEEVLKLLHPAEVEL